MDLSRENCLRFPINVLSEMGTRKGCAIYPNVAHYSVKVLILLNEIKMMGFILINNLVPLKKAYCLFGT